MGRGLRIGFPSPTSYSMAADFKTYSLNGQDATLTYGQVDHSHDIRFNPGHYMTIDTGSGGGGPSGWLDQINTKVAPNPDIKGVKFAFDWDDMEGPQGTYKFAVTDPIVNACVAAGKQVMLIPRFQYFSGSVINPVGRLPTYVISNGWYTAWDGSNPATPPGNLSLVVKLWQASVMDAWLALGQAYAARYNATSNVEMWMIGETSIANLPGSGYSNSGWFTQLARWAIASRADWFNTGVRIYTNYLDTSNDTTMQALMAAMKVSNITGGGPDNFSRTYQSNPVYTGFSGGIDYRNRIPWASENQAPASSSGGASVTPGQIYTHNETGLLSAGGSTHPNYYVWPNGILGGATWTTIAAYINSISAACNLVNPYGTP